MGPWLPRVPGVASHKYALPSLRAQWPRILGGTREQCSFIVTEERRRRRGHSAATLRADGGCGRSRRRDSSAMNEHRLLIAPRPRLASPIGDGKAIMVKLFMRRNTS